MKTKIIQFIPAALALAFVGFRYFSTWCILTTHVCYGTFVDHIALSFTKPLYFFTLYSLPLAIILIFVSRPVFNSWFRLAAWILPLALIFIATQPVYTTHILSTNRDDAARFAAEVITTISLILIISKYVALRRTVIK